MPRHESRPGGRAGTVAVGLAALAALAALVVAVPVVLIVAWRLLGPPVPALDELNRPDDGTLFVRVLCLIGWLAWITFLWSVIAELLATWRGWRLPAPSWQRRMAAGLIAAITMMLTSPAIASTSATPVRAAPAAVALATPATQSSSADTVRSPAKTDYIEHQVQPGEQLAALAERYLESKYEWQAIAEATYGLQQPDGRALRPGETRIYPGWTVRIPNTAITTPTPTRIANAAAAKGPIYEVAGDDWMWHIAGRFLGDPERYTEIEDLNPQYEKRNGRFPDLIRPSDQLVLPRDARDRGPRAHATGKLITKTQPPTGGQPSNGAAGPTTAQPAPTTTPKAPTPSSVATSQTPQPSEPTAPSPTMADEHAESDNSFVETALPITAALATAGLLAALLSFRLARRRQRQRGYRRAGRRIPQTVNPAIEHNMRAAAQPVDVNRLDNGLRALSASLRDREPTDLPDIAAVWLSGGDVHLMLAQANAAAPPPFQVDATSMNWTLPAEASVSDVEDVLAPVPALVTVASRPGGEHLLIDLERTGVLGIGGDRERAVDFMRYLAAELATNQWSDDAEVVLAGFDHVDADNLIAIGGDRITAAESIRTAIGRARRRAAANAAALGDAGVPSALAGRVGDIVADAWMPYVLLIADAAGHEDEIRALEAELRLAGRCAVVVAVLTDAPTAWRTEVTAAGGLSVDWLSVRNLTATRLPRDQLTGLAAVMRAARTAAPTAKQTADEMVPVAPETDPWAEGTDAHGHLLDTRPPVQDLKPAEENPPAAMEATAGGSSDIREREQERRPAVPNSDDHAPALADAVTSQKHAAASPTTHHRAGKDPSLDADLDAWERPDPSRPRIAILGPVQVEAPGEPPEERIRFYSELVVYLAQRGRVGATGEQIDDALWKGRDVNARSRRVAISKVRRWLGENADGHQWLPPNVGADRLYRLSPGILTDWQLFRRLRARGEARGADGTEDLRRALELVRGEPLAGADLPYSSGYRNPYTWLPGSDIYPHNLASAIVDTAHQLVDLYLAGGDTAGARWAVERAWLADPARLDDHPWIDAMRVAKADGRSAELRSLLDDLVRTREVEVPEDLSPDTYKSIHDLLGDLLRIG
jgi:hypothetical protein